MSKYRAKAWSSWHCAGCGCAPAVQMAELKRLQAERAARQGEVAAIDAETATVRAQNAQLNKQQAALQEEVRAEIGEGHRRGMWCSGTMHHIPTAVGLVRALVNTALLWATHGAAASWQYLLHPLR